MTFGKDQFETRKEGDMKKMPSDTKMLKEIITMVRMHYRKNFTGYDTYIDRSNIQGHILELCGTVEELKYTIDSILRLIDD